MVNNVVLIGRITRDLELRQGQSREYLGFSIAVQRNFKNANGSYDTDFINCIAFGQTAVLMSKFLQKGALVSVEGRMQQRSYENSQGQNINVIEVVTSNVQALESRKSREGQTGSYGQTSSAPTAPNASSEPSPFDYVEQPTQTPQPSSSIGDEDLPF